jgi:hypothetical protein
MSSLKVEVEEQLQLCLKFLGFTYLLMKVEGDRSSL